MTVPLDPKYIPAFYIEDVLLDKDTGAPLSGGLVYFYQDNNRVTLKPVYQITGTSPDYTFTQLPNPMTLSSIGTFEDALDNPVIPYFYPYDSAGDVELYYVVVKSSGDVSQFVREAVPYIGSGEDSNVSTGIPNEISNPQFAEVLFNTEESTYVYTVNAVADQVLPLAPNWDLVVSAIASGTITVSQLDPAGSLNIASNPATALNITNAGLTKCWLRQRIYGSPNLWGSGYLSVSFVAKTYSGASTTLQMLYSQSSGGVTAQLLKAATLPAAGTYDTYQGSALIPASSSTEFFPDAYVDIYFILPLSTEIDLTSIMVAPTGQTSVTDIIYEQASVDRQIDHLFHYYKPELEYKPIPSYTLGWDFRFNPCQELGTTVGASGLAANKSRYIADQTIAFEAVANTMTFGFNSGSGLTASTGSTTQFAIIQYLDQKAALELLQADTLAVMVSAATAAPINAYVNLYFTNDVSLPVVTAGTNNSLVLTMVDGQPATFNGTWTKITRNGLGDATFIVDMTFERKKFSGWDPSELAGIATATYFAVVLSFEAMPSTQSMSVRYCTLAKGSIATPPPPFNQAQTLQGLQYYYETSYNYQVAVGTATTGGVQEFPQNTPASNGVTYPSSFPLRYNSIKRSNATITVYNPATGTSDSVQVQNWKEGAAQAAQNVSFSNNWVQTNPGNRGTSFDPNSNNALSTAGAGTNLSGVVRLHFSADARLGVV